eukprot:jgi/Botrbrau1/15657/Bobra.4_1s0041.1
MAAAEGHPVTPQNQILVIAGRLRDVAASTFRERKPWAELVDRTAFARPTDLAEAMTRIRKNFAYFRVNYLTIAVIVTVVSMVLNPSSLIVLGVLVLGWIYLFIIRQAPLVIGGRTFSEREKMVGASIISLIVMFFLTSVGTILFTALGISVAAICAHGAFHVPDDLFTEEAEGQSIFKIFAPAPVGSIV